MKLLEKIVRREESAEDKRRALFAKQCAELTEHLADIRANFDYVTDQPAIDALIFEENATLCRLDQLYRDARAEGISVEVYERDKRF